MNLNRYCSVILFFLLTVVSTAQETYNDVYQRNEQANVENYVFNLRLNDENNQILGHASITVVLDDLSQEFQVDLIGKTETYGMQLLAITESGQAVNYSFENNKIKIQPKENGNERKTYEIKYTGIPKKGLVIDTTRYGQRSFFGDNWPNRARHWLPCVDHPYDKAAVEFQITAPEYYDVVATGKKVEESNIGGGLKVTRYKESADVATKVMTIGVTKFASQSLGSVNGTEVTAWVYPEGRKEGFADFEEATRILEYFENMIGPYAYSKLANVQAKTEWGGLENAGTITYNEKSINGNRDIQRLLAHEIAHQWFGNSATENSWNHAWLSEGFATYFAILYQESVDGNEKRKEELITDRKEIIEFYKKTPAPIIDNSIKEPLHVLNTNSYQKGGWLLNMLRRKMGDELFWEGIRKYYATYKDANVMSVDFQKVMEEVLEEDLELFFDQWLHDEGYPELIWGWKYKSGKLVIKVDQVQKHHIFDFPIEFGIGKNGEMKIVEFDIDQASHTFEIAVDKKPKTVTIDPDVWLLFEEK